MNNVKVILGGLVAIAAIEAEAQTVVGGNSLAYVSGQNAGANRFRNFGNTAGVGDNYLGIDGLGNAGVRVEQNLPNWVSPSTYSFSFSYDTVLDRLVSKVGANADLVYSNFLTNVNTNANTNLVKDLDWNAMQISITMRSTSTLVPTKLNLRNVKFNGSSLNVTDFLGVLGGTTNWGIQGYNFRNGFTLTGDIEIDGGFGTSQELNAINFGFGNNPGFPPNNVVPEPFTMGLGVAAAGAFVRRRMKARAN